MNKLIIFDCDGVLVDSELIANRITAEKLTEIGYAISTEDCLKKFTGISAKSAEDLIYEESNVKLPEGFFDSKLESIFKAFEIDLKPLILDVLQHSSLSQVRKCIASSSKEERILKSLELTKQDHLFLKENIFNSAQVSRGKPFPDLFLFAAKQMDFEPKDCLVIEDSVAGIKAAQSAQMKVIGFLGGSHAKFDWYKERIHALNIPTAHNTDELIDHIRACKDF